MNIVTKSHVCENRSSIKQASKCMKRIRLSGAKSKQYFATVDDEDFGWLTANGRRWNFSSGYAVSYIKGSTRASGHRYDRMHRLVARATAGQVVDHINGDMLDNRRQNLRVCSVSQNTSNQRRHRDNTVGFKGVRRNGNRYQAVIQANKAFVHVGSFVTPEEAALAYDAAALQLHGEFALLNSDLA